MCARECPLLALLPSTASIYEQIVERIREAVATGALKSGQKLQPVRRLADELDIAPGTVARAYVELERLGIIMTEGARGTRVADVRRNEPPSDDRKDTLAGLLMIAACPLSYLTAGIVIAVRLVCRDHVADAALVRKPVHSVG